MMQIAKYEIKFPSNVWQSFALRQISENLIKLSDIVKVWNGQESMERRERVCQKQNTLPINLLYYCLIVTLWTFLCWIETLSICII